MSNDPASPCTGTCTLDPLTRLCRGCARTIDEIMAWPAASAGDKRTILAALDSRRQSVSDRSK
jgi:predicted Fe-S protein YdhL (DUF1289 family)